MTASLTNGFTQHATHTPTKHKYKSIKTISCPCEKSQGLSRALMVDWGITGTPRSRAFQWTIFIVTTCICAKHVSANKCFANYIAPPNDKRISRLGTHCECLSDAKAPKSACCGQYQSKRSCHVSVARSILRQGPQLDASEGWEAADDGRAFKFDLLDSDAEIGSTLRRNWIVIWICRHPPRPVWPTLKFSLVEWPKDMRERLGKSNKRCNLDRNCILTMRGVGGGSSPPCLFRAGFAPKLDTMRLRWCSKYCGLTGC